MTEAIKLKKGFVFCFENQVYRGGSKKRGVIPALAVGRIEKVNQKIESDNKKNNQNNKTIDLKKFKEVEEANIQTGKNDKSTGTGREPFKSNS